MSLDVHGEINDEGAEELNTWKTRMMAWRPSFEEDIEDFEEEIEGNGIENEPEGFTMRWKSDGSSLEGSEEKDFSTY